jgi:hypothetical protein
MELYGIGEAPVLLKEKLYFHDLSGKSDTLPYAITGHRMVLQWFCSLATRQTHYKIIPSSLTVQKACTLLKHCLEDRGSGGKAPSILKLRIR